MRKVEEWKRRGREKGSSVTMGGWANGWMKQRLSSFIGTVFICACKANQVVKRRGIAIRLGTNPTTWVNPARWSSGITRRHAVDRLASFTAWPSGRVGSWAAFREGGKGGERRESERGRQRVGKFARGGWEMLNVKVNGLASLGEINNAIWDLFRRA